MDYKSSTLLNAIRNTASVDYQNRVPEATETNLAQVGTAIMDYDYTRNEFTNLLFNKIGLTIIKNKMFENPLKEFKKGFLTNGQDIEEVFVELIKAQDYDPTVAESELFKQVIPDVRAIFHRINREDLYKVTIRLIDLMKAFTSESSMGSLVDKIINTLYNSDSYDEFLIMKNAIQIYGTEGKFIPIVVNDVTDEATAKMAMVKIKEVSNNLTFLNTDYNYAGVHNTTLKDNQIVLINTRFDALVDVEVLASAFNMEKTNFIGRRKLVDDFGGLSNVLCAIVDSEWFMMYDRLIQSEQVYNPQGLYYNHFLHHHGVYSTSVFENAVLFVTVQPDIDSISVYPATATLAKGAVLQLAVEATMTAGIPVAKCVYTTSDATKAVVNSMGTVVIPKTATAGEVTITATSIIDATETDTCVITVA